MVQITWPTMLNLQKSSVEIISSIGYQSEIKYHLDQKLEKKIFFSSPLHKQLSQITKVTFENFYRYD